MDTFARGRIDLVKVRRNWEDILRVVASTPAYIDVVPCVPDLISAHDRPADPPFRVNTPREN